MEGVLGLFTDHFDFLFVEDFALLRTLNVLVEGSNLLDGKTMHN